MSTAYIMGIVVGVLVAVILALIIYKLTGNPWKGYYDERQELIRGRGYKYACFTLLILMAVDMLIEVTGFIDKLPVANEAIMFIFIITGVLVYAIYSIMHDAYLGIGQNGKSYTVMILFIVVSTCSRQSCRSEAMMCLREVSSRQAYACSSLAWSLLQRCS
jgi:hypothetical protein